MFVAISVAARVQEIEVKSGNAEHGYCRNNDQADD
jgi:hypothetical protein